MMEVESGSQQGQTIFLSARSTSTKAPTVTTQLSGTTTGTSLSLMITTHPTLNFKEDV